MARKRERFERTDVPRESPYRNVVAIAVLAAVAIALFLLCSTLWNRVQREANLKDASLVDAMGDVSTTLPDGTYAVEDDLTRVLVLTVGSLSEGGTTLSDARVVVVDGTLGTGAVASVPLESKVVSGDSAHTLADLCSSAGADACVAPLASATGVRFDHVVIATEDVLPRLAALAGTDPSELVSNGQALLTLMRTDMGGDALVGYAGTLSSVGIDALVPVEVALYAETATADDGSVSETGFQLIDKASLGVDLGLLGWL